MPQPLLTDYLAGYPYELVRSVQRLLNEGTLGDVMRRKYQRVHGIRSDKALYEYVDRIRNVYLRNSVPISKVVFDNTLQVVRQALGTHTRVARVQGVKLKSKGQIHIASVFKELPEDFLRTIVVHELAHLRIREHSKEFYQLCQHMEPDYHQLEFDLRVWLLWLDVTK